MSQSTAANICDESESEARQQQRNEISEVIEIFDSPPRPQRRNTAAGAVHDVIDYSLKRSPHRKENSSQNTDNEKGHPSKL